jgi:hypothetical protein
VPGTESPPHHQEYREEARRVMSVAADVKDRHIRVQLVLIASLYEKLAQHVSRSAGTLSDKVL